MTLGGESTGSDLVVEGSPLVASLLVASLPGGDVTINLQTLEISFLRVQSLFMSIFAFNKQDSLHIKGRVLILGHSHNLRQLFFMGRVENLIQVNPQYPLSMV